MYIYRQTSSGWFSIIYADSNNETFIAAVPTKAAAETLLIHLNR